MPHRFMQEVIADRFVIGTGETGASVVDDLTVGGAATVAETLQVTGLITATAGIAGNLTPVAVAAEHGAGVIGTGVAPVTYRWTENGVIITRIKVDLQGLASVATANDAIGLSAGGVAKLGQNVVATNGIIYKIEMACVEATAGGDDDVNLVVASSGTLAYGDAAGTTYGINSGDWTAGKVVENLVQGLTANHYFYLAAGTGDTAAAYTAGQFIITMYGHPVLT
jgi:hypothetical protein